MKRLITLSSDFAIQSQGVGAMELAALEASNGTAAVVHLMHGIPEFNIVVAARTMEGIRYFEPCINVCVCDPGVGTRRRAIALQTTRGDVLIGPDNGLFLPACRMLGGVEQAVELINDRYFRKPVSPVFHGRDIFATVAGHLARGVGLSELGPRFDPATLATAPYEEATRDDRTFSAQVIQVNHFGSVHLNILHEAWDELNAALGTKVSIEAENGNKLDAAYVRTFGDVSPNETVIFKDDYGRIEIAVNLGRFVDRCAVKVGSSIQVTA